MKRIFMLSIICALIIQCNSNEKVEDGSTPEENSSLGQRTPDSNSDNILVLLVQENIQAMEDEDLNKAMNILSEKMASFETDRVFTQQMFSIYDLDYEIEEINLIEQDENAAEVELIYTVKKIDGAEFYDQRNHVLLHFTKENTKWKVIKRDIKNTEYL